MKSNKIVIFVFLLIGFGFAACNSTANMANSPNVTVNYANNPSKENLDAILKKYRGFVKVPKNEKPPQGLCAEYAILLLSAGKKAEALKQFEAEKKYYPESQLYVEFVKNQLVK